jgi:ABC-type transport system involved in multi-copper enzyme maturation permease subunit
LNGTLAVARYTLVELTRRRILLAFFIVGALGILALGLLFKVFSSTVAGSMTFGSTGSTPDPEKVSRFVQLSLISNLNGALSFFALLIAFGIGMTVIYHDLDSGAAVAIFSKPVSRAAFAAGKVAAAVVAMVAIVGLLSVEARLMMLLFSSSGIEGDLTLEALAQVANAVLLMLLVMALSTWMNNIIAVIVAFVYNFVSGIVVALYQAYQAGSLGHNDYLNIGLTGGYWIVPHRLVSGFAKAFVNAEFDILSTRGSEGGPSRAQLVAGVAGASGPGDILWWAIIVCVFAGLVYVAVRRRQV